MKAGLSHLILSLLVLNCLAFASAQEPSSNTHCLSTGWEFLRSDLGGIWEAVRSAKPGNPESVPVWEKVTIPHCFNARDAVDPVGNYYQGPGWYRTNLQIQNPYSNGRTILHFEGAGQKTEVYVYTTKVATHIGGYDEWSVDITDQVNKFLESELAKKQFNGMVPLSIRCDNSRDLEMIPSSMSDFIIYGGIYRNLYLEYIPAFAFDRLFVNPVLDSTGKLGDLKVCAIFNNKSDDAGGTIHLQIFDPKGKLVAQVTKNILFIPGENELWNIEMKKPQSWSPSHPFLYTCQATLHSSSGNQQLTEKFGFRNFEFLKKGPFHLNGERLLLRGTHRHEDHAGVGAALTDDMMRNEITLMKEMGVNFIRLGHYQQSRTFLNLCDSVGILVWEEIPWCRGGIGGEVYKNQARNMLRNMIGQHRNHPSIIIWGLGNENDWPGDFSEFSEQKIRDFMNELNLLSHKLDSTRKTAIRRCDFCKDIVDVYSPSIWAGWYRGIYTEYRDVTEKEMQKVDRFLHIEWGGDSHARRHSEAPDKVLQQIAAGKGVDERLGDASLYGGDARVSKDGDWSESYICNLFDWHLKEQENMPWLTGSAFWIFKDFATPLRPDNPVPYVNQKGVVERDFTKKESYYVFQSYWTEKPMAHIYGHSWPVRWGTEGEEKMVKVYSNCTDAELFLNGKSLGVKHRNSQDFPAAGLRWNVSFTKGENRLKVLAVKDKVTIIDELSQVYQTETWGKPVKIALEKVQSDDNIVSVEVKLLDGKNILCLDCTSYIAFSLAGDGHLLDDLGTSSGSRKVQLYNGRALIRVVKNKGKSVIGVSMQGLQSVFIEI